MNSAQPTTSIANPWPRLIANWIAPKFSTFRTASRLMILLGVAIAPLDGLKAQSTYTTPATFTTLAGSAGTYGVVNDTGTAAQFNLPTGVAVDSSGNSYVADSFNNVIRKITPAGVVTTLAAGFIGPKSVAVYENLGEVYVFVADYGNHVIKKITVSTAAVTTLAGSAGNPGSADGTGTAAQFNYPDAIAADSLGNVYVTDTQNHTIRKITSGGEVTTFAGSAGSFGTTDATGTAARFEFPAGVAVDSAGNVFVADTVNDTIRKITSGGVVSTLAGGAGQIGSNDGTGTAARFNRPAGVAVDGSGNVYVADTLNHTIRKITSGGVVSTLAGAALADGTSDGAGSVARFNRPSGIAVGALGNIYVADYANHTIRMSKFDQSVITVSSAATATFGSPYNATSSGGSGTGAVTWSLGTGSTAAGAAITSGGGVSSSGVGTVVVKATKAADIHYLSATSGDFTITVGVATATVTLGNLSATYDGSTHAATATTSPASLAVAFTYDGSATVPTSVGTYAVVGTISNPNYTGSAAGSLVIAKAIPVITWAAPTAIYAGTALSNAQLNATANVAGTFMYSPAVGTIPSAGSLTLNATFTPTDSTNYNAVSAQQTLVINVVLVAPVFSLQPGTQSAAIGSGAAFAAMASGTPTPTYQWKKGGVTIPGATNSTYTITSVGAGDAGSYTVVATNSAGSVPSNAAVLTPFIAPPSNAVVSFMIE